MRCKSGFWRGMSIACALSVPLLSLYGSVARAQPAHAAQFAAIEKALAAKQWERAKDITWRLIVAAGDRNNDAGLDYGENDSFPCSELRQLTELWRRYYGSDGGYDNIVMPRFHGRAVSCGIYKN